MKVRIFTLQDIVRYCERILARDADICAVELKREAMREGCNMNYTTARRYAWTMQHSTLVTPKSG